MKYLVLYWDEYGDPDHGTPFGGWVVWTWQTNRRTALREYRRCAGEHRRCKLMAVGETLMEQHW